MTTFTTEEKAIKAERAIMRARDSYHADLASPTIGKAGAAHCYRTIRTLNEILNLPSSSLSRLFDGFQAEGGAK